MELRANRRKGNQGEIQKSREKREGEIEGERARGERSDPMPTFN